MLVTFVMSHNKVIDLIQDPHYTGNKERYGMDNLDEVFNKEEVESVLTQEGLGAVGDLFGFYNEALEVAVNWISVLSASAGIPMEAETIRGIITNQVENFPLNTIVGKFEALSDFQESLNEQEEEE